MRKEVLQSRIATALQEVESRGYRLSFDAIGRMLLEACQLLELDPQHIHEAEIELEMFSFDFRLNTYTVIIDNHYVIFDYTFTVFSTMSFKSIEKKVSISL